MSWTEEELCAQIATMDAARKSYLLVGDSAENILKATGIVRDEDRLLEGEDAQRASQDFGSVVADAGMTFVTYKAIDTTVAVDDIRVQPLREIGARAKVYPTLVIAVDISETTPVGCMPLKMGAQIVYYLIPHVMQDNKPLWAVSLMFSKARKHAVSLSNESFSAFDAALNACSSAQEPLHEETLEAVGAVLSSLERDVIVRNDNANSLAQYLRCHPSVERAVYPSLPQHPDKAMAASVLMHGFGSTIKLILKPGFVDAAHVVEVFAQAALNSDVPIDTTCTRAAANNDLVVVLKVGSTDPSAVMKCLEQALYCKELI